MSRMQIAVVIITIALNALDGFDVLSISIAAGSIRTEFASSIGENATHGSDAPETAAFEIGYFCSGLALVE